MPRHRFAFTKDRNRRFAFIFQTRIVVVAKGSRRYLLLQHQLGDVLSGFAENVADLAGRNLGPETRLFHYVKPFLEQKELRQKISGRRPGVFECDHFAAQIF